MAIDYESTLTKYIRTLMRKKGASMLNCVEEEEDIEINEPGLGK